MLSTYQAELLRKEFLKDLEGSEPFRRALSVEMSNADRSKDSLYSECPELWQKYKSFLISMRFSCVPRMLHIPKPQSKDSLNAFNYVEYAQQHGFDIKYSIEGNARFLSVGKDKYPVNKTLPIIDPDVHEKNVSAALISAAIIKKEDSVSVVTDNKPVGDIRHTPGDFDPILVSVMNLEEKLKTVDQAEQLSKKELPSTDPTMCWYKTRYIDNPDMFRRVKEKGKVVRLEVIKPLPIKIPKAPTLKKAHQYLLQARGWRCKDDSGYSGLSNGYRYGLFFKKENSRCFG